MIHATEALRLPSAKLSDEELAAVAKAESELETACRKQMKWNGVEVRVDGLEGPVIAELNQRLKSAGWAPTWKLMQETHPLNKAVVKYFFQLMLAPSDDSYRAAGEISSALVSASGGQQ